MDNRSSHKRASAIRQIEATGATVRFLPPYSPDLNPIENIFSKVKQGQRSLALRSREAMWAGMQSVLDTVTPTDALNCIRRCGYTLQTS